MGSGHIGDRRIQPLVNGSAELPGLDQPSPKHSSRFYSWNASQEEETFFVKRYIKHVIRTETIQFNSLLVFNLRVQASRKLDSRHIVCLHVVP